MRTIEVVADGNKNVGMGFDILRLVAAGLVLVSHAFPITLGDDAREPIYLFSHGQMTLGRIAVGIFFATSGYLIARSLISSSSLVEFGWRRFIRIFPALWVVVAICALVVGPALTSLPLVAYFSHPLFAHYASNAALLTSHPLPGVFASNPVGPAVNGSLWTLIYEVGSYALLVAFGMLGMLKRRVVWGAFVLSALLITAFFPHVLPGRLRPLMELFVYFGCGALIYLYRGSISYGAVIAGGAVIVVLLSLSIGFATLLAPPAIAYVAVWFGFQPISFRLPGDYSYGVYLWAFPVQQVAVHFLPGMSPLANMAVAVPVVAVAALLSWTLVEKPSLRLKGLGRSFSTRLRAALTAERLAARDRA